MTPRKSLPRFGPAGIRRRAAIFWKSAAAPAFMPRGWRRASRICGSRVSTAPPNSSLTRPPAPGSWGLDDCRFEMDDVYALARPDESADAVVVSRLFMMLRARNRALGEIHRVLRAGGTCFLAEPRSPWRAAVPLYAMWAMVYLLALTGNAKPRCYGECRQPFVLSCEEFNALVASQPWSEVRRWQGRHYHYALCRK